MATSSSIDYSLTAREIIEYALQKINILAKGESATARHSDGALRELNMMLKEWMIYPAIWRRVAGSATPTASTASISIASSVNPYRIIACRYRNASSIDLPMTELTHEEYYDLPNKTVTGIPTQWYFEPTRSTNTLYIWPLLSSVSTETIRYTYQRRFEDVDDLANEVDVGQEWLSTVGLNLAGRLADDYGRKGEHINRIVARAEALFERMQDADRPEMVRMVPGYGY